MPKFLKLFIPQIIRSSIKKSLHGHGLGRHNFEDIYYLAFQDLDVIRYQLQSHKYILGTETPSIIDAIAYAFISNILLVPIASPLKEYILKHKSFQRYCDEMNHVWHEYGTVGEPTKS